jgi:hypothetical protein
MEKTNSIKENVKEIKKFLIELLKEQNPEYYKQLIEKKEISENGE